MSDRSLLTRLRWMISELKWDSNTVVLQTVSISFDPSAYEFFGPLLAGGTVVLAQHGMQGDPAYIADVLQRFSITDMTYVPSLLAAFLAVSGDTDSIDGSSLRNVICGGEALPVHTAVTFNSLMPNVRLLNAYGPTEACIIATMFDCSQVSLDSEAQTCSIGQPAAHSFVRVVDPHLKSVPNGVAGELLIGGAGISPGYLFRPGLTAERFIPDHDGRRLYRTGDLVKLRPGDDGLEFCGSR